MATIVVSLVFGVSDLMTFRYVSGYGLTHTYQADL